MFTGIITDIGEVASCDGGTFAIRTSYAADTIALGASIACDGCCLTVTSVTSARMPHAEGSPSASGERPPPTLVLVSASHPNPLPVTAAWQPAGSGGSIFTVDVSNETLSKTTLGAWKEGCRINLERSLKAGGELGGHFVTGHVDGVARILDINADGDSRRFTIEVPQRLARFIASKGSVALDGISLTVNAVSANRFGVNMIPHTLTVTTWGRKRTGGEVNIEIDPLARYAARLMEFAP